MKDRVFPGQGMQRAGYSSKTLHIPPVITSEAQERANFRGSLGRRDLPDGCQERRIRQEAFLSDPVTQVADLLCSKGTFVGPQLKVGVLESLKDLAKSSEMLLPSGGEEDNIVEIKQACLPVEAGKDFKGVHNSFGDSFCRTV